MFTPENPPSQLEYVAAIEAIRDELGEREIKVLRFQFQQPGRAVTSWDIRDLFGYSSLGNSNLLYGGLGTRFATALEMQTHSADARRKDRWKAISTGDGSGDHFTWIMRPELANALVETGLVDPAFDGLVMAPDVDVHASSFAAVAFRDKLIDEVYPELGEYLKDDAISALSRNLKTSGFRVRACFDTDGTLGAAKRIVAGNGRSDGSDYGEAFENRIWDSLKTLNQNPKLKNRIADREAGDRLSRDLFFGPVCTLTGRIRGAVGFSQARNTPFQGLAADGAKLALWGLYKAGFRCVAFVHDEVVIELPISADHAAEAKKIDSILCDSMRQLTGTIPIACEYALADRWYKEAESVFSEGGKLQLWRSVQIMNNRYADKNTTNTITEAETKSEFPKDRLHIPHNDPE